jgi:hypothetical protein
MPTTIGSPPTLRFRIPSLAAHPHAGRGSGARDGRDSAAQRLLFSWATPLMRTGAQKQLDQHDLLALQADTLPARCSDELWAQWSRVGGAAGRPERAAAGACASQIDGLLTALAALALPQQAALQQPSLLRALVSAFGRPYFWLGAVKVGRAGHAALTCRPLQACCGRSAQSGSQAAGS